MQVESLEIVPGVSGIILAGGRSRRMGREKALLPVPGHSSQTFVEYLVSVLSEMCSEMLLVARDETSYQELFPALAELSCRVVYDLVPDQGPLMGLMSGLRACTSSHALVLAVDLPCVAPKLLAWLCAFPLTDEVLLPHVAGMPQVLLARYPRAVLSVIEACLRDGRHDPRALLNRVPICLLEEERLRAVDPELRSFLNVNTPEDFKRVSLLG